MFGARLFARLTPLEGRVFFHALDGGEPEASKAWIWRHAIEAAEGRREARGWNTDLRRRPNPTAKCWTGANAVARLGRGEGVYGGSQ